MFSSRPSSDAVLVIAHRGASGYRPEHTLAAYALAVRLGADFIEPDLVRTRDGVLVARHENEISETTDVAHHPAFAGRRTTKEIDGREVTGWFVEDLTLAELRTLRAVERLPGLRPGSARYDGRFPVPTLGEIVALAREMGEARGRPVGLYPETKHPSYFDAIGLGLDEPLVAALHEAGYRGPDAPVFLQSFEVGNLRALGALTDLRRVFLAEPGGAPADRVAAGDLRTYDERLAPEGLADVAAFAEALGVHKAFVLPPDAEAPPTAPAPLVAAAHDAGLGVHAWTVRAENAFLPASLRSDRGAEHPGDPGDVATEARWLAAAGVDGLFTDHPDRVVAALR